MICPMRGTVSTMTELIHKTKSTPGKHAGERGWDPKRSQRLTPTATKGGGGLINRMHRLLFPPQNLETKPSVGDGTRTRMTTKTSASQGGSSTNKNRYVRQCDKKSQNVPHIRQHQRRHCHRHRQGSGGLKVVVVVMMVTIDSKRRHGYSLPKRKEKGCGGGRALQSRPRPIVRHKRPEFSPATTGPARREES